jgi:DNA-binding NarL/FixJ family response regulator
MQRMQSMKKRMMLVDGHLALRQMLARILNAELFYEVVAEAHDGLLALEACRHLRPDLVILDLVLPGLSGSEVLRRMRLHFPSMRIVVFSGTQNDSLILNAFQSGPHGFVDKRDSLETLIEAVRAVANGKQYFSAFAPARPIHLPGLPATQLTPRELEVLQLVAESRSSKEIASRLSLSKRTVENHRARIMDKLDLHDVAALTRFAMRRGMVM